jgi:hypothetical protein
MVEVFLVWWPAVAAYLIGEPVAEGKTELKFENMAIEPAV